MAINIAIDGPAGAGKSSAAKALAKKLSYIYMDTGALYRTIGLYCVRNGCDVSDASAVEKHLSQIEIKIGFDGLTQQVFLNGENVSDKIRTQEISMAASTVSAHPVVRSFLLDLQRDIAKENNLIMDGRDIGSVILPNADVKIFLTASPEARAKRRYSELIEKGEQADYNDVLEQIIQRDKNDSTRAIAPLKVADDAVIVDNSDLNKDETIDAMIKVIEEKIGHVS